MDKSHVISLQTPLTLEHSYFQAKENVPMETIETDSNNITKKNTQIRIHPPSMKGKNRNTMGNEVSKRCQNLKINMSYFCYFPPRFERNVFCNDSTLLFYPKSPF